MIQLRGLHRSIRPAAEWTHAVARFYGVPAEVTSTYRDWQTQARLRARFETCVAAGNFPGPGPCRFPANRPGDSAHNYGLAWDSVTPSWAQDWWNEVRRAAGFEVLEHDQIHAQVPRWRQLVGR